MTAFEEPTTGEPTTFFWNTVQLPTHEHTCQACGVKTIERPTCTVIMKEEGMTIPFILCNKEAVFHCAGKCKQSFCSWHAFNTNGYCSDCWPLKYPDGALRES